MRSRNKTRKERRRRLLLRILVQKREEEEGAEEDEEEIENLQKTRQRNMPITRNGKKEVGEVRGNKNNIKKSADEGNGGGRETGGRCRREGIGKEENVMYSYIEKLREGRDRKRKGKMLQ